MALVLLSSELNLYETASLSILSFSLKLNFLLFLFGTVDVIVVYFLRYGALAKLLLIRGILGLIL